jgi:hypothetical protein
MCNLAFSKVAVDFVILNVIPVVFKMGHFCFSKTGHQLAKDPKICMYLCLVSHWIGSSTTITMSMESFYYKSVHRRRRTLAFYPSLNLEFDLISFGNISQGCVGERQLRTNPWTQASFHAMESRLKLHCQSWWMKCLRVEYRWTLDLIPCDFCMHILLSFAPTAI